MENNYTDLLKSRSSGLEIETGYRHIIKPNQPKIMDFTEIKRPKRHIDIALDKLISEYKGEIPKITDYINIENINDIHAVVPIVSFKIQSDPISEVGINGVQATDLLMYVKCLFESLNEAFPCIENSFTINDLKSAIAWQENRTKDRIRRQVEGQNKV